MHSVTVKIKNRAFTYRFNNEDDKKEAEKMANETQEASAEEINNALETIKNLQEEIRVKNEELETEKTKVKEYAEKLQEVLAPEAQEALAEELLEQKNDEEEIIKSEVVEEERDEVKNRLKNAKSRAERRRVIVAHIMNKQGVTVDDTWKAEAVDGAFAAMSAGARRKTGNNRSVPGGTSQRQSAPAHQDNYARMMGFRNKKKEDK